MIKLVYHLVKMMTQKKQKNNIYIKVLIYTILFIVSSISIYLSSENIGRSITLLLMLLIWLIVFTKYNNLWYSLILLIIFSSFNITFTPIINDSCYKIGIYVNYLCPTLHISDIFTTLLLLHTISFITKDISTKYFKYLIFLIPIILFLIYYLFSLEINSIIYTIRLFTYIYTILIFKIVINEKELIISKYRILFYVLLSTIIFQLIIAYFQFYNGTDMNLQWLGESNLLVSSINSSFISLSSREYLRGYGTFPHPNILSGYILGLYLFISKNIKINYYEKILLILFSIFVIFISFSRLSIVLFILIILIEILFKYRKDIIKKFNIFSFFSTILIGRFNISLSSNSVSERISLIKESLLIIKDNIILGVGGGNFVKYLSYDISTNSNISLFQPVHNIFILLLSEYGILGSLYFILLLLYTLVMKNNRYHTFISLLIIISIGLFEHYLVYIPQGILVLIMML